MDQEHNEYWGDQSLHRCTEWMEIMNALYAECMSRGIKIQSFPVIPLLMWFIPCVLIGFQFIPSFFFLLFPSYPSPLLFAICFALCIRRLSIHSNMSAGPNVNIIHVQIACKRTKSSEIANHRLMSFFLRSAIKGLCSRISTKPPNGIFISF